MGQRICHFLVVFLLMFSGGIFGQKNNGAQKIEPHFAGTVNYRSCRGNAIWQSLLKVQNTSGDSIWLKKPAYYLFRPVPGNFYANTLGVICKAELKLDKLTPLPFRLRLGSVEYVNRMEGKSNALYLR